MIEDWLKGSRSNFDFNIKFMTRSINNFIDSLVESNKFESYKKEMESRYIDLMNTPLEVQSKTKSSILFSRNKDKGERKFLSFAIAEYLSDEKDVVTIGQFLDTEFNKNNRAYLDGKIRYNHFFMDNKFQKASNRHFFTQELFMRVMIHVLENTFASTFQFHKEQVIDEKYKDTYITNLLDKQKENFNHIKSNNSDLARDLFSWSFTEDCSKWAPRDNTNKFIHLIKCFFKRNLTNV